MFPEDLKREVSRYLHKKYYEVVLEELVLMTQNITLYLDLLHTDYPVVFVARKERFSLTNGLGPWFSNTNDLLMVTVARWDYIDIDEYNYTTPFQRKSIQQNKNELKGI